MINKDIELKIRKLIPKSHDVLDWAKTELENDDLRDTLLYETVIQGLSLISQIQNDLIANDSNITGASNSKKFKEQKLFP